MQTKTHDESCKNGFDFLIGNWRIRNRRLVARLMGCQEWEEFPGTLMERPVLDGLGSIGEFRAWIGKREIIGLLIRIFHPSMNQWSQRWIDHARLELEPPVFGAFANGRGLFEGDDLWEGKKVRARLSWTIVSSDEVTWEQAFSTDDGATWETNWTMQLTRCHAI